MGSECEFPLTSFPIEAVQPIHYSTHPQVVSSSDPKPSWFTDFKFNDGGREAAGYKGDTRDCVTRAISIATGEGYKAVYDTINEMAQAERPSARKRRSNARLGVHKTLTRKYLASRGFVWHPTMSIGSGTTVHFRADELPAGLVVVQLSRHVSVMIDGVINDTYPPDRDGTRCVYGYWTKKES